MAQSVYVVKYLEDNNLKVVYVKGDGESDANKNFSKKFPNVEPDDIVEIRLLSDFTKDYGLTIMVTKIVAFLGWITVIISAIIFLFTIFSSFDSRGHFDFLGIIMVGLPSLSALLTGFVLIIIGQSSRAVLDSANYSKEMLELQQSSR